MKRGTREIAVVVGGVAMIFGLSACGGSSEESGTSGETSTAAAAAGTSTVTIDGEDQGVEGTVVCNSMGGNVNMAIGDATTGIGAVVSEGDDPNVVSVGLGNVNGVTLGYQSGVNEGEATVEKDGDTYTITGTATGIDMANPMQPVNKPFEIVITCP
ncbi:MAG: lipoprotein LpqH [Actinomycetota bacterium]|nr:lipoprotein LpqH [Actinomycetota bacterium]